MNARRALTALAFLLAGCATPIHDDINTYRAPAPPLEWSVNLASFAEDATARMAASGQLTHSDLNQLLVLYPGLLSCAETIAVVPPGFTAQQIVDAWKASPPHAAVLTAGWTIEGDHTRTGPDGRQWAAAAFCY
jgi:uncharacterized protein YkwD